MVKTLMKRVPSKTDHGAQHKVMKNWSATIVETHAYYKEIEIFSAKEIVRNSKVNAKQTSTKP